MIDISTGDFSIVPRIRDDLDKINTWVPSFSRATVGMRINSIGNMVSMGVDVPRFDYDPVTLALRGLLIEESRTNLVLYSEELSNAGASPLAWTVSNLTAAANNATDPTGALTGDKFTENAAAATHQISQSVAISAGGVYAISLFVKRAAGTRHLRLDALDSGSNGFRANFDLDSGTVSSTTGVGSGTILSSAIQAYIGTFSTGWYRLSVVGTVDPASTALTFSAKFQQTAGGVVNYTGDGASALYLWGAQCEACGTNGAAAASSYIKTTTDAAARAADVFSVDDLGDLAPEFLSVTSMSSGAIFAEYRVPAFPATGQAGMVACLNNGSSDQIAFRVIGGGTTDYFGSSALDTTGASVSASTTIRQAGRFAYHDYAASVDGGAAQADTDATISADVDRLYFGRDSTGSAQFLNGYLRKFYFYDTALTNPDLVTLSGGGSITTEPAVLFDFTTSDIEDQLGELDYPVIGYHAPSRDGTASASDAADNYPADAAQFPETFEAWQAATAGSSTYWEVDLGEALAIDYCGIAAHDIGTQGAALSVQYSTDRNTWNTATNSSTSTSGVLFPDDDSEVVLIFSPKVARYWRLYVFNGDAPSTIAVIQFGRILRAPRKIYGGFSPMKLSRDTVLTRTLSRGGQFLGQGIRSMGLVGSFSLRNLAPDWYRENFDPFVESARQYPFFFAWRPADYPSEVSYCWATDDIHPSNMGVADLMQVSVPVRAHAVE